MYNDMTGANLPLIALVINYAMCSCSYEDETSLDVMPSKTSNETKNEQIL